ncbi:2'-5' RNA ligase family protein [Streptomyces sp. NPDC086766]|uniref:2'-5' RNA ligase family protein n=1 Tax=Streptomyces sp. NPDC086766 TaxID=3365754 RepID=UPI00380CFA50
MADDSTSRFQAGRTALIVRVPDAESAVRVWRERFDPSARAGVPAHVTVLFPFLDESRIDARVCLTLTGVLGRHRAFDLWFEGCGRFPGVLYLAPEPDGQLRLLTEVIADLWPEAPPYGGRFTEIVPHLTVADGQDDAVLDEIEADLLGKLPFTSRVSSVDLMVHDGAKWQERSSFALLE